MGTGTNKIIIAGLNTSQPGAYWQYSNVTVGQGNATGGLGSVLPPGTYLAMPTAQVVIEVNLQTANVNAWTTLYGNGTGGLVISDGQNVRANATNANSPVMTLLVVDPGSAANVTGTFNAV